jgi:hypothetical protein
VDQYRIFISHFGQEQPLAKAIHDVIKTAFVGHARVFMSSDIPKGTNWLNEVRDQLLCSDEVLTIFSHRSAERPWLNIETGFGVISGKPVTPILFGGFLVKDLSVVYQLHQAVDWRNDTDVSRLFSDIHSRIRTKNPDAESRWTADQFRDYWKTSLQVAVGKVPLTARRRNDRPVIWLIGSQSQLVSRRERSSALLVSQVIAKVCLLNHIQIVSGSSRMLDYLADEYENYREYFTNHPDELTNVENEPLRKFISSEHATNPVDAPNPIILLGSLRRKGARDTFDDAIGRVLDMAILVGGSPLTSGRAREEVELAQQSAIPVLPIRFTGGIAGKLDHTLNPCLNATIDKLQNTGGRMDEFASLLVDIIYDQLDLAEVHSGRGT